MKNKLFNTLFLLLIIVKTNAQFAIITDKDGFVNVRSEPKIENNIQDTLRNGHFVYLFEISDNWVNIDYNKNKEKLNGYIYKDRYILVSEYSKIPIVDSSLNSIKLKKDSIEITLNRKKFNKINHTFKYHAESKSIITLIDNDEYFGTDGELPKYEYEAITIKIGKQKIILPQKAIKNLFEVNLYLSEANYDEKNKTLYIQAMNSDGAGGYFVIWKIVNGVYKERYVAYGF